MAVALGLLSCPHADAQNDAGREAASNHAPSAADKLPKFEVDTVKPVDARSGVVPPSEAHIYPGGRVVIDKTLKRLIAMAFHLSYFWQISGGADWVDKNLFNIEAEVPSDMQSGIDIRHSNQSMEDQHLRQMLQALLIDRFQLKFHVETRTGSVYVLERSGKALRLQPSNTPESDASKDINYSRIGRTAHTWLILDSTLPQIAEFVADDIVSAPVLDRTGLDGSFDFRWQIPDDATQMPGSDSSFLEALGDMGLKLKRTRGPVETFIIDKAQQPSAD